MCYGTPSPEAIKGYRLKDTHRKLYFDGSHWAPDASAAKEYKSKAEAESDRIPYNTHECIEEVR